MIFVLDALSQFKFCVDRGLTRVVMHGEVLKSRRLIQKDLGQLLSPIRSGSSFPTSC